MASEEKSVANLRAVFEQKSKNQEKPGIIRSSSAGKLVGSDEASKILARANSGNKLSGRKSDVPLSSKQIDSPASTQETNVKVTSRPEVGKPAVVSKSSDEAVTKPKIEIVSKASDEAVTKPKVELVSKSSDEAPPKPKVEIASKVSTESESSKSEPEVSQNKASSLNVDVTEVIPPEAVKSTSPTSRLLSVADAAIPPTVEEQDFMVLKLLSFVVPFFLLRFVFELVRKFILGPARMTVRFAPGGNKFLGFVYRRLGPVVLRVRAHFREKLPPMDDVNSMARSGLEKFLATLHNAAGAAWPHLLHLAESMKTLKFREAATEVFLVLRAWAPMLLLLIPFVKNSVIATQHASIAFWNFSKNAFYLPFGRFLRGAVQSFGKNLSENPDVFAERLAGLLGPIVVIFLSFLAIIGLGLSLGLVDYSTLSSFYLAWFFRLVGMVSEPHATASLDLSDPLSGSTATDTKVDTSQQATGNSGSFLW